MFYWTKYRHIHVSILYFSDDHGRVVLEEDQSEPDSDYINANYIDVSVKFLIWN